jgi:hypothetical protein
MCIGDLRGARNTPLQIQRQSSQFILNSKQDKCPNDFSKILQKKEGKHLKTLGCCIGGLQKHVDLLRERKVSKRIQNVSHQIQEGCMWVKFFKEAEDRKLLFWFVRAA